MRGPEGERIRESLKHAEPVEPRPLLVNREDPAGAPLQSAPQALEIRALIAADPLGRHGCD
jgi:hypothetical protein